MSEVQQNNVTSKSEMPRHVADSSLSLTQQEAKKHAVVAYILMVLGLITGVFWLAGAIWAMVKKGEARGTLFEDHYSNIIKTFWVGLVVTVISIPLAIVLIGYITLFAVWLWSIYRIIKGVARLSANQSYYASLY